MQPFWLDAAKTVFGTLKLIEVVGEVFAAPPYAYIIETGLLERKVLS